MAESSPAETELDGRSAAVAAVADALQGRRFVSDSLRDLRAAGRLSGRDAALAMELGQGTLRHLITLEHVLRQVATYSPRRTPPTLRAILCTAAYQIIWMDRVPPFAAVDQAVDLARRLVRGRAPGMVNAVLRRVTAAVAERSAPWRRLDAAQVRVGWERACGFNRPVLPAAREADDAAAHLAAAAGERLPRYTQLCRHHGAESAEAIAWASQAVPVTVLQRNPLRATPAEFEQRVRALAGESVEIVGDAAFLPASAAVVDAAAFREGLFFIQDAAAHAAAEALAAQPGERVLDLCAAPGGKTVALAMAMSDRGTVVACDADADRLARVVANVSRLGLTSVHTRLLKPDQAAALSRMPPFDAALLDAPCSNTGVIARRPEARLGLLVRKLRSLAELQAALLRQAAGCVRRGGRLVYSTCSLEPEENEQIIHTFLSAADGWRLDVQQTMLPVWGPRWSDWRDGGYFARLIRMGT